MSKRKILVSVLVPIYNTEEYLSQCLDSLTSQTLKDIEIICVNDGSTDQSLSILEEYAKKDSRIVIVNKPNGGLPSARNAGIMVAKGEYVGFVDSDDYVELNMFEKMYKTAKRRKSEIVVCGAQPIPQNPEPTRWIKDTLSPRNINYKRFSQKVLFDEIGARPFLWRNLIKLDLIKKNNLRLKEDIVIGEDQAFQFKVFPKAKGISFISDKLYIYRWCRPGSLMNKVEDAGLRKKVYAHAKLIRHVFEEMEKGEVFNEVKKQLINWSSEFLYVDFIGLSKSDKIKVAKDVVPVWGDSTSWEVADFHSGVDNLLKYFYKVSKQKEEKEKAEVSIIVNLDKDTKYISEFRASLESQKNQDIEVIFINNGCDNSIYYELTRWASDDLRVRIINQNWKPKNEVFNLGLGLAEGKKVLFADPHNYFASEEAISKQIERMDSENSDVLYVTDSIIKVKESMSKYDIYDMIFSKKYIIDNNLCFKGYNELTEQVFATEAVCLAQKVTIVNEKEFVNKRANAKRDWVYKEEMEDILLGFRDLLILTRESKMKEEHRRIVDDINSIRIHNLIVKSTRLYLLSKKDRQNLDNSQIKSLRLLIEINKNIKTEYLQPYQNSLLVSIKDVVNLRHAFLDTLVS